MIGDMQNWRPNVAGIIEHARSMHPNTEVVSRLVSGEIHKTNYEEVCIRSRKLASALEKDGIKKGDVVATLALNTYRHLEMYYGISGMGAITHTLNFRLHPEQAVYIINHAEDKMIFVELPFVPILEGLQDNLSTVEKYVVLCNEDEMPETSLKNALSYEEYIKMVMKIIHGLTWMMMQPVHCVIHLEQRVIQKVYCTATNQIFSMLKLR